MLVSIVMPSFNQARYIPMAIESVLNQSWQNLELIVMDGGSSDGTQEILKAIQEKDQRLRWWSETDTGPANAINKALRHARGTIIGWLNSDDLYSENAVKNAVQAFNTNPKWLLHYGYGQHINEHGSFIEDYPTIPDQSATHYKAPNKTLFQKGCFICQPTVFFKKVVLNLIGHLDENLKVAFDFDYWLKAFNAFPERIGFVPQLQAFSRLHEQCLTQTQRQQVAFEGMKILSRHQHYAEGHWVETFLAEKQPETNKETPKQDVEVLLQDIKPFMYQEAWQALKLRVEKSMEKSEHE